MSDGTFDYDNAKWPDPPVTKAQVEAWYSTATEGEKIAMGKFSKEYREWLTSLMNVVKVLWEWQGKVRELAKKYQATWPYCTYNTKPGDHN